VLKDRGELFTHFKGEHILEITKNHVLTKSTLAIFLQAVSVTPKKVGIWVWIGLLKKTQIQTQIQTPKTQDLDIKFFWVYI
jgi:hypothetical protein